MATEFAQDPRKQQELLARPAVESTLYTAFAEVGLSVARINWTNGDTKIGLAFDKYYGVDGAIYFFGGSRLSFQAKALSPEEARFGTITIEHYNNPATGETGDWFNCIAQIYVCGYTLPDFSGMLPWAVVNYPALKIATLQNRIQWGERGNWKSNARASFKFTPIAGLPDDVVIARGI